MDPLVQVVVTLLPDGQLQIHTPKGDPLQTMAALAKAVQAMSDGVVAATVQGARRIVPATVVPQEVR